MNRRIAKFEKVSYEQFEKDYCDAFGEEIPTGPARMHLKAVYERIGLPQRATRGSAGYDFETPISFELKPGETIKIPTGIKCQIDEGWDLALLPRSGSGSKYRLQLDNTVGIIDEDYYNNEKNEGHIFVKMTSDSKNGMIFEASAGDAFCQGKFEIYGLTKDDAAEAKRTGGFGSTGK